MVFPVVMCGCESWTIKKAEHQRIDAFELWCWRRLLRVPWTARRSNLSILKEISPKYSLEGLILKLKLQSFGHVMWRADSFEKTLMLGTIEGWRRRGRQGMRWMASPTQWTWVWVNSRNWWWTGRPGVLQSVGSAKSQIRVNDWTEQNWEYIKKLEAKVSNFIYSEKIPHYNCLCFVLELDVYNQIYTEIIAIINKAQ